MNLYGECARLKGELDRTIQQSNHEITELKKEVGELWEIRESQARQVTALLAKVAELRGLLSKALDLRPEDEGWRHDARKVLDTL